jgi:hypothetical protein
MMDPIKAVEMVHKNTICVATILGSTYSGEFENVKLLKISSCRKTRKQGEPSNLLQFLRSLNRTDQFHLYAGLKPLNIVFVVITIDCVDRCR